MKAIIEKIENGAKWNGTIYANDTIYLDNEKFQISSYKEFVITHEKRWLKIAIEKGIANEKKIQRHNEVMNLIPENLSKKHALMLIGKLSTFAFSLELTIRDIIEEIEDIINY